MAFQLYVNCRIMIKSLDDEHFEEGLFSEKNRKILKRKHFSKPLEGFVETIF